MEGPGSWLLRVAHEVQTFSLRPEASQLKNQLPLGDACPYPEASLATSQYRTRDQEHICHPSREEAL